MCNNDRFEDECEEGSCSSIGCDCDMSDKERVCCDGTTFDNECVATCNGKKCDDDKQCKPGICQSPSSLTGIFSLGKASGSSQWNIIIVIIQLCILAVCCMSLGLSISFCFKNPNKLIGGAGKSQSFGRNQY